MADQYKIRTKNKDVFLRVAKGHFATMHSHTNYYIDVTTQKTRLSEAKAVAKELVSTYRTNTIVDTILCLDGTEVIGACVADELTREDYVNMNAHQTIYVIPPEFIGGGQMIFRDNLVPMLTGKHVLILAASVTTGKTAQAAIEAVKYYKGLVVGVSAIFATVDKCGGYPVTSIFDPNDLGDYNSYNSHNCPICEKGERIEAIVNSYGYSAL
ncbi:MAG: orotate phosphoribosyltransferase [Ruminococcus sp.]|nr:orotate phosphoribosyltransferase [Ruminococcus sp.]MEE0855965.1 orotate phosphoribosyltransferase [Ruminococcus sp.]MEE1172649.1 orotate phosphoribosyltransferase [Ruminococcus sp.]